MDEDHYIRVAEIRETRDLEQREWEADPEYSLYHPKPTRKDPNNLVCPGCGTTFKRRPSYVRRSKMDLWCTQECRRENGGFEKMGKLREGKANPNFKHGLRVNEHVRGWGPSFKGETCCRVCGHNGYLHLHHVIPRSKSSAAKKDLRNGITLCVSCHKRWHAGTLTITRDIFTKEEWEYISSVQLTGERIEAWLDKHYPEAA